MKELETMDLIKLMDEFHSEEKCREVLAQLRWPGGVACIRCGSLHIRHTVSRNQYDCGSCGYQFSVTQERCSTIATCRSRSGSSRST